MYIFWLRYDEGMEQKKANDLELQIEAPKVGGLLEPPVEKQIYTLEDPREILKDRDEIRAKLRIKEILNDELGLGDSEIEKIAKLMRLSSSGNPVFSDKEFVESVRDYVRQSIVGDREAFKIAYYILGPGFDTERVWKVGYKSWGDLEVNRALTPNINKSPSEQVEDATRIIREQGLNETDYIDGGEPYSRYQEMNDPYEIGKMDVGLKAWAIESITSRIKNKNLDQREYEQLNAIFERSNEGDTFLTEDDLNDIRSYLSEEDILKIDEVRHAVILKNLGM